MRFTRKNKYNARKTVLNGVVYDSKKEAERGEELIRMAARNEITGLERQVKFVLIDPFTYQGKKIRATSWVADFYYCKDGQWIAEDVKSSFTRTKPDYNIKKKLFMQRYPEILFFEYL